MALADMLSLVQTVLTLAALVYVIQQTRYLRQSIQGSTYQSIFDSFQDLSKMFIEYPELAQLYSSAHYGRPEDSIEETRKKWAAILLSDNYENMFLQHEAGTISHSMWKSWEKHVLFQYRTTFLGNLWPTIRVGYTDRYRSFIDKALAQDSNAGE